MTVAEKLEEFAHNYLTLLDVNDERAKASLVKILEDVYEQGVGYRTYEGKIIVLAHLGAEWKD